VTEKGKTPEGICKDCGRKWFGWSLNYDMPVCDCGGVITLSQNTISLTGTVASIADRVSGHAYVLHDISRLSDIKNGEVLIVEVPSPDLVPVLNKVCAIVSAKGGRTAHLAKVCRERNIPCLVSVHGCMDIETGWVVTVDTDKGCIDILRGKE